MLSRQQARDYYDRFGSKQDRQGFYEDAPLADLVAHARFGEAVAVAEFGSGTGRFAENLLAEELPESATYAGFDVSGTMVELASRRLARFGARVSVTRTAGAPTLPLANQSVDRVVSTYVLDLLTLGDVDAVLREAHRVLVAGGLLAVTGLAPGTTLLSSAIGGLWTLVHRLSPTLVGGCRPLRVVGRLAEREWRVDYHRVVIAAGIPSEVLIAERL